jgi:ketosteroid isomerase-like protein
MWKIAAVLLGVAAAGVAGNDAPRQQAVAVQSPQQAVEELVAADRAFSRASAGTDVVTGLSAMFAPDVIMPIPGSKFARGADDATAALRSNPDNLKSRAEWIPIRGGISADGQHGFTFGYMTLRQPNDTVAALKYLAYWIKTANGWRAAAYKRSRTAVDKPASTDMMPPSLPTQMVPASNDAAAIERHRQSLIAAEGAFSAEAQKLGIGPAFVKYGSADAVNAGPPTQSSFIVGAEAIGRSVGEGYGPGASPVSWGADSALVASSGDLAVTFGMIRATAPGPEGAEIQAIPAVSGRRSAPAAEQRRSRAE